MAECERVLEPLQVEVDVQADLDLVDWNGKRVGHGAPRNVDTCGEFFRTESINSRPLQSRNICFHVEFVTRAQSSTLSICEHGRRKRKPGGNCWDNAVAERFFLNLKMERVWQRNYANHAEAKCDIAAYIVEFYNSHRLHSVLGNLPPSVYERKMAAKEPIDVSGIT